MASLLTLAGQPMTWAELEARCAEYWERHGEDGRLLTSTNCAGRAGEHKYCRGVRGRSHARCWCNCHEVGA